MIQPLLTTLAGLCALVGAATVSADPSRLLFDFEDPAQLGSVKNLDSQTTVIELNGSRALRVETGTDKPYPNVTLHAPEGSWDFSTFERFEIDVTNLDQESLKIGARVDNPNANGRRNSNTGSVTLGPGETGTLTVVFDRKFAMELRKQLHGMRYTPWGVRGEWGGTIDPSNVVKFNLFLNKPAKPHAFALDNARVSGTFDPSTLAVPEPFFPFIDRFGQYMHADWPGKIKDESDLHAMREAEARSMASFPRPADWDRYGGWAEGPRLEATGHFRTARHGGKWHLVDPEGRLFFSLGISVVRMQSGTPILEERDHWFAAAPWKNEPGMDEHVFKRTARRGAYKDRETPAFSFYSANLQRKYGDNWRDIWLDITPRRLMNWGINTIATWSEPELLQNASIPYTHWVYFNSPKLPWRQGTRNRVPDPFHELFEKDLRRRAQNMTRGTIDDPYCIGYFVDNELSWGHETFLAEATLMGKPNLAAKKILIEDMKAKYGALDRLNEAWGVSYDEWLPPITLKELPKTEQAREDLLAFNDKIVRTYFQKVRRVMKEVAPDKLYLGCRFAAHNPQVVRIAAEYCDVVSFNLYRHNLAGWRPPADIDKPIMVGEFHFGTTDRGVFGDGLVGAPNSAERAGMFTDYVESAIRNPLIVGVHWFLLVDQSTTGRINDGENYGIGFLSITDTPDEQLIDASRRAASDMYRLRNESAEP